MRTSRPEPRAPFIATAVAVVSLVVTASAAPAGAAAAGGAPRQATEGSLALGGTPTPQGAASPALALAPSSRSTSLTTSVAGPGVAVRANSASTASITPATASPLPAGPWTVGPARPFAAPPQVESFDLLPAGVGATLARVGSTDAARDVRYAFGPVDADGVVGRLRPVPARYEVVAGPAFDRRGRGVVAIQTGRGALSWATMRRDGSIGPLHALGRVETGVRLAVDEQGDLVIAWVDRNTPYTDRGTGGVRVRVRVALRPAGGSFRTTETLPLAATLSIPTPTAAIGPGGRVVVGVSELPALESGGVSAWTGTVRRGLEPRRFAGRQRSETTLNSFVGRDGLVVLAWATQSRGEEISSGVQIRAATLRPGASRFGPMRTLDPGGPAIDTSSYAFIGSDRAGGALLTWDNVRTGRRPDVSLATVDAAGRFSTRRAVASGATGVRLATGPRGAALLTWLGLDAGGGGTGVASYRAAGATRFGAPEGLPAPMVGARPLFWPTTGRPTLAGFTPPAAAGGDPTLTLAERAREGRAPRATHAAR